MVSLHPLVAGCSCVGRELASALWAGLAPASWAPLGGLAVASGFRSGRSAWWPLASWLAGVTSLRFLFLVGWLALLSFSLFFSWSRCSTINLTAPLPLPPVLSLWRACGWVTRPDPPLWRLSMVAPHCSPLLSSASLWLWIGFRCWVGRLLVLVARLFCRLLILTLRPFGVTFGLWLPWLLSLDFLCYVSQLLVTGLGVGCWSLGWALSLGFGCCVGRSWRPKFVVRNVRLTSHGPCVAGPDARR